MQNKLFNHDVLNDSVIASMVAADSVKDHAYTVTKVSFQGIKGNVMEQTMSILDDMIGRIYSNGVTIPFGFCGYSSLALFDFSCCGISDIQGLAEQCAKDVTGEDIQVQCNSLRLMHVSGDFDFDKPTYCYVVDLLQQDMVLDVLEIMNVSDVLDMIANSDKLDEKGMREALVKSGVNSDVKDMNLPFGAFVVCTACKTDISGRMRPNTNYEPWNNSYKNIAVHSKTPFISELPENEQDWVEYWLRDSDVEF